MGGQGRDPSLEPPRGRADVRPEGQLRRLRRHRDRAPREPNSRYTGWSKWYWDETGDLVHADVTVNPQRIKAFASQDRSCQRKHTITHEFGHVLGLRHYPHSHAGSVMSYLGWQRLCGGLTAPRPLRTTATSTPRRHPLPIDLLSCPTFPSSTPRSSGSSVSCWRSRSRCRRPAR